MYIFLRTFRTRITHLNTTIYSDNIFEIKNLSYVGGAYVIIYK